MPRPKAPPLACVICGEPCGRGRGGISRRVTCSDECFREACRRQRLDVLMDAGRSTWTRGVIIAALRADANKRGRPPLANEWRKATKSRPAMTTVARAFGSWNKALSAAGLRPRRRGEWRVGPQLDKRKLLPGRRCRRGHKLTPKNTYVTANGYFTCRACHALWQRQRRKRERA